MLSGPLPLLRTKFFMPRLRPGAVARPHLTDRLNLGLHRKLTLLSAPAGFGKTTLMAQWRATPEGARPLLGWVTLDEGDQDPICFWLHAAAALDGARPGITGEALAMLRSTPPPPLETVLPALVNALAEQPEECILVLDDYHLIASETVHTGVRYLLEHQPANFHLVLLTRADPPLPLARLRAGGELAEIRAQDLRFREDEAAALLGAVPGVSLSPEETAQLAARTEGWAAGLQLAGLSLQGREDARSFVAAFVSSHQYLVDYLVEEVLLRQPAPVQQFLLYTSVLERLCGPLCDAVTGVDGGRAMLEMLEQRCLFTVALDAERQWFRYHHLFADLLRTHLRQQAPQQEPELYLKACAWFRAQGLTGEAVRAALAASDFEQAADLVEAAAGDLWQEGQITTLRTLLGSLPETILYGRPGLLIHQSRILLLVDAELTRGESLLARARAALNRADEPYLEAQLATLEAHCARAMGDMEKTVRLCHAALAALPIDDTAWRPPATLVLALTHQECGDLEAAVRVLRNESNAGMGSPFMSVLQSCLLGDTELSLGRLREAYDTYQRALRSAAEQELPVHSAGWAHVGLGAVLYEWNRPDDARQHLQSGLEWGQRYGHLDTVWRASRLLAYICQMQGDLEAGRSALAILDALVTKLGNPMTRAASLAQHAYQHLLEGRLAEAVQSCERIGAHLDNALAAAWPETLAPARVAAARGRLADGALPFLRRRLELVAAAGELDPQIRTLALLAVTLAASGDEDGALAALEQALTLGEPLGYLRTFLDEGAPMVRLLHQAEAASIQPGYVRELLGAFDPAAPAPAPAPAPALQPLVEPLTDRELEVLRLAATGLSYAEIGARIYVTPGTVKNHLHNIHGKLGVATRLQAINRGRELGLL